MSGHSKLLSTVCAAILLTLATTADARSGSTLINRPGVRVRLNALVKGTSLQLTTPLSGATAGISASAARKAKQTAQGFNSFNYKAGAQSFVVDGRRKMVVTTANIEPAWGTGGKSQYFVARDGRSGTVVGRGYVTAGGIAWTRSKNGRGAATPSERNAAAK